MTTQNTSDTIKPPHTLLKNLLKYIEEQAKDSDPKGYCLSSSKGFVCRSIDCVGLPGAEFDLRTEGDHVWLHLNRLEADKPSVLPEILKNFVTTSSDPFSIPPRLDELRLDAFLEQQRVLNESRLQNNSHLEKTLSDNEYEPLSKSVLNATFKEYLATWQAWSILERPRRKSINLYHDLFALKHQIEAEETAKPHEFVWGMGVSSWKIKSDDALIKYEYPLLTQSIEIAIDENTMALQIRPRATETRPELAPFIICSLPGSVELEHAVKAQIERYRDNPITPFNSPDYAGILKLVASHLDSNGSFIEILASREKNPSANENLTVTDSWAFFSRPRANNYLTDDLKKLKANLEKIEEIPIGPLSLVSQPSDTPIEYETIHFRGLSSRGGSSSGSGQKAVEELFFPLPYNEEQVTIIQRLEKAPGVTVQGPPGTGKTHTIANIICHYLATGRRVLVTSRGEQALAVLQSKIPEEVRKLTVALLTSDREGIRQFQHAIDAIQFQVSQLNPKQTKDDIATLKQSIDSTHNELTSIDKRIDEIAIAQLSNVEVDGIPIRPQKLAKMIIAGGGQHDWFDDELILSPENTPSISDEEATEIRTIRRKIGKDLVYINAQYPSADSLPDPAAILELHEMLSNIKTVEEEIRKGALLELKSTSKETLVSARELVSLIDNAMALTREVEQADCEWPIELRKKCQQPSFFSERKALQALFTDIDSLIEARSDFLQRPVDFPEAGLNSTKTRVAIDRGVKTGKPFGLIAFGADEAKGHLISVKVSGLPPATTDDWSHIQKYVNLHDQVVSFLARWNQFTEEFPLPRLEGSVSALRHIEIVAVNAKNACQLAAEFDIELSRLADDVFLSPPTKSLNGWTDDLMEVKVQLLRHINKAELSFVMIQLSNLQEKIADKNGPISTVLKDLVENLLGNPAISSNTIVAKHTECLAELRRIAALGNDLSRLKSLVDSIDHAGAKKLAYRLSTMPAEMSGDDTVFPATWRDAWTHARIKTYLEQNDARLELIELSSKRQELESGLARLYSSLVAKAAWLATKEKASPKILSALAGYANAIRRIGKGTGPNAIRYRRDAKAAMLDAAGAVPCWIMSHAKISESMPSDIGMFDLVIVDEASQSDLWALPAVLRGKKILVVGDDKQVSPDGGFISSLRIQELRARFLTDQPYGTEMTPEKSFYDLAARVFASEQVMLREHFRCVPPIIAYSNRVFYKNSIQPLRIPKASERIDPPLVDIHVINGVRDHRHINKLEAQSIADEITTILQNDQLVNRTIGVVSLLGIEQAKYIDTLVREQCDITALIKCKFECGDARTFQGSERDIMFLSLVVDSSNCKALSGNMFEQRFNVAASRAKERMYLIRSVEKRDLSAKDLRLTLLEHFDSPLVTEKDGTENLIDLCESGFEREVFSTLTSFGYSVIPQVKAGAYRIDMVIEGANDSRLAIELDGDDFHGPDRWAQDMNRQRILERSGWIFWRCFASTWQMKKNGVLNELLLRLKDMGIEPLGALKHIPKIVEKRIYNPPPVEFDNDEDEGERLLQDSEQSVQDSTKPADIVESIVEV